MQSATRADFERYQTDVLFLLIGTNPLPNYVAARLLAKHNGLVYLLHTPGRKGTAEVANRLKRKLDQARPDLTIIPRDTDEVDGDLISAKITEIIQTIPSTVESVGLNYSGGTKPMAVHTYHKLSATFPNSCFSYLDARSLRMVINRRDEPTQKLPVGQTVELGLEELLELHGYRLSVSPPRDTPRQPALCRAIVQAHLAPGGLQQWRDWTQTLCDPAATLPTANQYPALAPAIQAFADLGNGSPSEAAVASALGPETLQSCSKFFVSGWLEEYTFEALRQCATSRGIKHLGVSLEPRKPGARNFELDVAAMDGYQLFAISCMVTDVPKIAKGHLFEVFVRARQLGGDEARLSLVSFVKNPTPLQREIEQDWDAEDKIRVFGAQHIQDLSAHLQNWFETANKEA